MGWDNIVVSKNKNSEEVFLRRTDVLQTVFGLLVLLIIHPILLDMFVSSEIIEGPMIWRILITSLIVCYQVSLISRALRIWYFYKLSHRKEPFPEGFQKTPEQRKKIVRSGFSELYIYLVISLVGLCALGYLGTSPSKIMLMDLRMSGDFKSDHIFVFLCLLISTFVPLSFANFMKSKFEADKRQSPFLRDDVISPTSFVVFSVLLTLIVALISAASSDEMKMTDNFGVFVTVLVVVGFLSVIFVPNLTRELKKFQINQPNVMVSNGIASFDDAMKAFTGPLGCLDSILVRVVAPVLGVNQRGWGHALITLILMSLAFLGFVLASPFGLIPVGIAMLFVFSIARRWAWVEEDRDTASRLQLTRSDGDFNIGFDNDTKDEAILAYASFFILVPLILYQIQGWLSPFQETSFSSGNAFIDWVRFFGAELAKAVPFVDWFEIYNVEVETPFSTKPNDAPLAKHLTFVARAMVDLIILGALIQAISISHRRKTEKRLYKEGQLKAFDPFLEREMFETGMTLQKGRYVPTHEFESLVEEHCNSCERRGEAKVPYSPIRLTELVSSPYPELRAGAEWMRVTYDLYVGTALEQLEQLGDYCGGQEFLHQLEMLKSNRLNDSRYSEDIIWKQQAEFTRIMISMRDHDCVDDMKPKHFQVFLNLLGATKSVTEFALGQKVAFQVLSLSQHPDAITVLAANILQPRHLKEPGLGEKWETKLKRFSWDPLDGEQFFQPSQNFRIEVYHALGNIKKALSHPNADIASQLLEWMQDKPVNRTWHSGDRAEDCRQLVATYMNS